MENSDNKSYDKLIVSSSPHIMKDEKTKNIIWLVSLSLFPATFYGIYIFGFNAGLIVFSSIITALLIESFCLYLRKKRISIDDGSAFLTGLLIGLNMPPNVSLYIPILSTIFGIAIVKQAFGGLGNNWANPAISARLFAQFAWTKQMNTWNLPFGTDSVATATPLGAVKSALMDPAVSKNFTFVANNSDILSYLKSIFSGPLDLMNQVMGTDLSYFDLFIGNKAGCIGEVSVFLLTVGALYLIYRKIVTLDIPLSFLLTVILISWIFGGLQFRYGYFHGDFLFQLLTGGLVLGAFFMATDMVTTPITTKGRIIFGIGCGVITMLVRFYGSLSEGVGLSILFMNMLTPAIDRYIKKKPLGFVKLKK